MIRVMVVDDEPLARIGVTARLKMHSDIEVVGECDTGEEALRLLQMVKPDLIFLDIQMSGISGLEVLDASAKESSPAVIFLTAHNKYAVDAFEREALDYLLKPIDDTRFLASLDRARRLFSLREGFATHELGYAKPNKQIERDTPLTRFSVSRGRRISLVKAEDVDWIEGLGDYAGLHVGPMTHLIRKSLSSLEKRLDSTRFLRIHRSTIVNIDRILHIERLTNQDAVVILRSHERLRASRSYHRFLKGLLKV
jgi:two-component system, LytTR family, response regulator